MNQSFKLSLLLIVLVVYASTAEIVDHSDGRFTPAPDQDPLRTRRLLTEEILKGQCLVTSDQLANFAKGKRYNFNAMVNFLTVPACQRKALNLSSDTIKKHEVVFNKTIPFKLDMFSKPTVDKNLAQRQRTAELLSERYTSMYQQDPLGSQELLPLIGQLSLLSPKAAQKGMVDLAKTQLYTADDLSQTGSQDSKTLLTQVGTAMLKLGMDRDSLSQEFAHSIEDMAVVAQADSLTKIMRTLGGAALINGSLVPTFNKSAEALKNGISAASTNMNEVDENKMISTVYRTISSVSDGSVEMFPAFKSMNEAMHMLISQQPLSRSQLKGVWKDVIVLLTLESHQTALAQAVALSLNDEMIFMNAKNRLSMVMAAQNYEVLAKGLQKRFLNSFQNLQSSVEQGEMSPERFLKIKTDFMRPWVTDLMALSEDKLLRGWLKDVFLYDLVTRDVIENNMARLILSILRQSDSASQSIHLADGEKLKQTAFEYASQDIAANWILSQILLPELFLRVD